MKAVPVIEVEFAPSLQKHIAVRRMRVEASYVGEALESVFANYPALKSYVLEDQGQVRQHMTIFVNDRTVKDRQRLSDSLSAGDRIYVFQALSGG